MTAADENDMQVALELLHSKSGEWAALEYAEKVVWLEGMLSRFEASDHVEWSKLAVARQGYALGPGVTETFAAVEQIVSVSIIAERIRTMIRTYRHLAAHGVPPQPESRDIGGGLSKSLVFPFDSAERKGRTGQAGVKVEVHSRPGEGGELQGKPNQEPGLCLVLGAGNQSSLAFSDVLYWLFVEGKVVVLKHHPERAFSFDVFASVFEELSQRGYFAATLDRGIEHAGWLTAHPLVTQVHMTGGVRTHDAIVWGSTREAQESNKQRGTPVLRKPMSSELGCITPWAVCPGGVWTAEEIDHHAGFLALSFVANNSCNCCSPKLVVLDKDWPQAKAFVSSVRSILGKFPLLPQHYPGTSERYEGFRTAYPSREEIPAPRAPTGPQYTGGPGLPWMLLDLDAGSDQYALLNEAFCPVLGFYHLSCGNNPATYLEELVTFLNESVWGSLSATIIVRDELVAAKPELVDEAIRGLRYGTIALNNWSVSSYELSASCWGGYPGESLSNVASGIGTVGNALLLRNPEKTVMRAPFKHACQRMLLPDGSTVNSAAQLRAIASYTLTPSAVNLTKLLWRLVMDKPKPRPPPPPPNSEQAGILLSRGATTGLFCPRYFVLEGNEFRWYGPARLVRFFFSSAPAPKGEPRGLVRMTGATVKIVPQAADGNLYISVTPAASPAGRGAPPSDSSLERTHEILIAVPPPEDHAAWLGALQRATGAR